MSFVHFAVYITQQLIFFPHWGLFQSENISFKFLNNQTLASFCSACVLKGSLCSFSASSCCVETKPRRPEASLHGFKSFQCCRTNVKRVNSSLCSGSSCCAIWLQPHHALQCHPPWMSASCCMSRLDERQPVIYQKNLLRWQLHQRLLLVGSYVLART